MLVGAKELREHAEAWFTGWSALRSYQTRSGEDYWAALRLDRSSDWEYFTCDPSPAAFTALAAEVAASPKRALCVIGPRVHEYVKLAHHAKMGMVSTSEHLMMCDMENQDNQDPFLGDPELTLLVKKFGGKRTTSPCQARFSVAIVRGETVMARGTVGIYGENAIFDGLKTRAAYRRRGFGMLMMKTLTAKALDYPVTTGLLLASTRGQRLYSKLGWASLSPVTVLVPKERLAQMTRL
ncbi:MULTISPECIES: GNAT family N-acetyltransferase [Arthrobacter]|uniref:GNAT family N-acetyltransferase n=1 Tax=unclassified Arthrobacter TaxID=235627 RepID=UPI0024B9D045|nr:GNAT family N-acetyltransferase [Arthrobacter sp. H35-MC1]MDJ0317868.1 GNAT family N-acetyltransferase [Arthrobacter sp. H35-MC1]